MVRASARQNFDGDAVASSRNFNDAMVRNRRFTILIYDRMEHQSVFENCFPADVRYNLWETKSMNALPKEGRKVGYLT